jgi:transcriptional regulator with XRE-family HTH domain
MLSVHSQGMESTPYAAVLAANIRAMRSRRGLGQETLAKRMRGLGHGEWVRQTVGATERGRRKLTVGEVVSMAAALDTTVVALMVPSPDDKSVSFPSGVAIAGKSMQGLITGHNDHSIYWRDDAPELRQVEAWWGDGEHPPEEA